MRTVVVSGFAGIGGFDLAAKWMVWETIIACEIDPFCQQILRHHFPEAYIHDDIKTLTGDLIREKIKEKFGDESVRVVFCSGFPCQPHSTAGKREGTEDDRNLWPDTARVSREFRFDAVVYENVLGLASTLEPPDGAQMEGQAGESIRGSNPFVAHEHSKRDKMAVEFTVVQQRFLATILQDIEDAGYETAKGSDGSPIVLCVPACGVGAPHRRDRVWIVANRKSQ